MSRADSRLHDASPATRDLPTTDTHTHMGSTPVPTVVRVSETSSLSLRLPGFCHFPGLARRTAQAYFRSRPEAWLRSRRRTGGKPAELDAQGRAQLPPPSIADFRASPPSCSSPSLLSSPPTTKQPSSSRAAKERATGSTGEGRRLAAAAQEWHSAATATVLEQEGPSAWHATFRSLVRLDVGD